MRILDKYKICPSCGEKNDTYVFECLHCECDITREKITDDEAELQKLENDTCNQENNQQSPKKICECGAENPPNGRKCASCGEDISDISPVQAVISENISKQAFSFSSLDGQFTYEFTEEEVTIGRECGIRDYLKQKPYVSRIHARITVSGQKLFIENCSQTNFTYVNQQKITEVTELTDGDEIGLGGTSTDGTFQEQAAYFRVRVQ